jgi:tartrate dehydratase alpha subunit/fumarate hydratase class I-like protein
MGGLTRAPAGRVRGRLLADIDALGIGPGGLGGDTTALAVHVADRAVSHRRAAGGGQHRVLGSAQASVEVA